MLKIWGRRDSFNLQKVMWCVAELNLECQRFDAGGVHGVTNSTEYLSMNPNGRVPTIDDDGFVLWESNSIVRYLAAKYGVETLYPSEINQRAEADRWMEWQSATVGSVMRPLIITMFRTRPEGQDPNIVSKQIAEVSRYWAMLDGHLATHKFVAGNTLTMGDIPIGCYAWRWFSIDADRPKFLYLRDWYKRLCDRTAYRENVMIPMASN